MKRPIYVYDNWSAYDELSDAVPLTEELALFQLAQVKRLKEQGVKFDAYLMDAYWYDPASGYKEWRKDRWPEGPEHWLELCAEAGLMPGLWFPANTAFTLDTPAAWRDSLAADGWGFCCFSGGFLAGFMEVLRYWYGRGVRVFKFDFADFGAAPDAVKLAMLPSEIRAANVKAYQAALLALKRECPEAILLGYNGFEEAEFMPWTDRPVRRTIDPSWLEVFDTIYCGDPRPADLPLANFWRTCDIYADHEIRYLNLGGLPMERLDNCALMIGPTDTCYRRGSAEWRTTWLLSYARRGNVHVTMGDLSVISDEDALWIAGIQALYEEAGLPEWVGGMPGKGELYGYRADGVTTLVNPGLETVSYPLADPLVYADGAWRVGESEIALGPGGVVVARAGGNEVEGARPSLEKLSAVWTVTGKQAELTLRAQGELHFGFTQVDGKGLAVRSTTGSGPGVASLGTVLKLRAFWSSVDFGPERGELQVELVHDRVIWSGISWAYGIVRLPRLSVVRLMIETSDAQVAEVRPFLLRAL